MVGGAVLPTVVVENTSRFSSMSSHISSDSDSLIASAFASGTGSTLVVVGIAVVVVVAVLVDVDVAVAVIGATVADVAVVAGAVVVEGTVTGSAGPFSPLGRHFLGQSFPCSGS